MNITREQFEKLAKKHLTALRGYDINQTMGIYGVGKLYDDIVESGNIILDTEKNKIMKKNESVKKLKVGKDYVNVYDNDAIVIDRAEDITNRGFEGGEYRNDLICSKHSFWREATEEEVIEAFKRHLIHRYGEDWRTMKIKEVHPSISSSTVINDDDYDAVIAKLADGWNVWNVNGLIYRNGIWVERLEEPTNLEINDGSWGVEIYKCYDGWNVWNKNGAISTGWSHSPEDIKEIKAGEKVDERYALKRDVLTILSVESRLNPDKKISEYLEQFKLILEVL